MRSEVRPEARHSVKVTLKDLPVHSVRNEDVLETMRTLCTITSTVKYSNLWFEGKATSIQNGDRYLCGDELSPVCQLVC